MPRAQNNLSRRLQTHHQTHPEHSSPRISGMSSFSNRKISRPAHTHYAVRSSWEYTANRPGARWITGRVSHPKAPGWYACIHRIKGHTR